MTTEKSATFEEFRKKIHGPALRFARRNTRSQDEAEDVLQEAYVKAFVAFDQLENTDDPSPWFFQILRRVMIDSARSNKRRPEFVSLDSVLQGNAGLEPADERLNPEQIALGRTMEPEVAAALQRIDPRHFDALKARAFDDGNTEGVSRSNLKKRVFRARRAFLQALREVQVMAMASAR